MQLYILSQNQHIYLQAWRKLTSCTKLGTKIAPYILTIKCSRTLSKRTFHILEGMLNLQTTTTEVRDLSKVCQQQLIQQEIRFSAGSRVDYKKLMPRFYTKIQYTVIFFICSFFVLEFIEGLGQQSESVGQVLYVWMASYSSVHCHQAKVIGLYGFERLSYVGGQALLVWGTERNLSYFRKLFTVTQRQYLMLFICK